MLTTYWTKCYIINKSRYLGTYVPEMCFIMYAKLKVNQLLSDYSVMYLNLTYF